MKWREIYIVSILGVLCTALGYFDGVVWVWYFIFSLCIYALLAFPVYVLWKKLRKKKYLTGKKYVWEFLYRVVNICVLLFVIVWGTIVYQNEVSPASMPQYTLTNGKKVVYFQSMVHIGLESFYADVRTSLKQKKKQWAVLYYEGVAPGTPENTEKFNKALWIQFSKDLYKNFSKLYGVTFQNNEDFLEVVNNYDYNVDISIDDIMALYAKSPASEKTESPETADLNKLLIEELAKLDEKNLKLLVYVNQWIMNFLIKSRTIQETMMNEFGNKALFDVILGKRNEVLAKKIWESRDEKIFVMYGLLHFEGVLKLLLQQDPEWKVIETQDFYPFHTPFTLREK